MSCIWDVHVLDLFVWRLLLSQVSQYLFIISMFVEGEINLNATLLFIIERFSIYRILLMEYFCAILFLCQILEGTLNYLTHWHSFTNCISFAEDYDLILFFVHVGQ